MSGQSKWTHTRVLFQWLKQFIATSSFALCPSPLPVIEEYCYKRTVHFHFLMVYVQLPWQSTSWACVSEIGKHHLCFYSSNNCFVRSVEIKSIWRACVCVCLCSSACGGYILTDSSDTISSPLFPAKYPHNQNCSWIIQAQPPCK